MRSSLTALIIAAIASVGATPSRRDGCDGLSGTDNVSNFKLVAVHQVGDSITFPSLDVLGRPPSLLSAWIAVSI